MLRITPDRTTAAPGDRVAFSLEYINDDPTIILNGVTLSVAFSPQFSLGLLAEGSGFGQVAGPTNLAPGERLWGDVLWATLRTDLSPPLDSLAMAIALVAGTGIQIQQKSAVVTVMFPPPPLPPPPPPVTSVTITTDLLPPQVVGTLITLTAHGVGGVTPYMYKWMIYRGSSWTVVKDWTLSNTYVWTPLDADAGYLIGIWARSAGVMLDSFQGSFSAPFPITPLPGVGRLEPIKAMLKQLELILAARGIK